MSLLNSPKFLFNRYIFPNTFIKDVCKRVQLNLSNSSTSIKADEQDVIDSIFPDVEGSPTSLPKNYFKKSKERRTSKSRKDPSSNIGSEEVSNNNRHVVIECKNQKLNHYSSQKYDKFSVVPLASKGWFNKQSRGDFFKINILPEDQKKDVFWFDGIESFGCLELDEKIVETLMKLGFTKPTYIQAFGIPEILSNQNTLLAGETGCGKTLAYLLPLVQEILRWRILAPHRKLNCPLALILVPGKELTYQIGDIADQLSKELQFDIDVAVGGHTNRLITHPNFRPVDLFISSVGAARKLTSAGIYSMKNVRHVVLDEADTCLDDSFSDSLMHYLKRFPISYGKHPEDEEDVLPKFCKLTLASATMPTSIAPKLGNLINPESLVKIETPRLHQVLVHVPQIFYRVGQSQKPPKLLELAKRNVSKEKPTIIFSNRSKVCDWVSMFLNENGVSCVNLNGDMPVDIRAGRFDQFQRGFVDVLSCTDMASRGLDTIRAKHVVNYDFPVYMADYIHRCGRVGRVGHIDDCLITNLVASLLYVHSMSGCELRTVVQAKHVVNYDFPVYMADYIHRCGRVGRVGHIDDCLITNLVASLLYVHSMSGCELRMVVQAKHVINYDFPVYMADYIHRCGRVSRVGHIDDCLITNLVASLLYVHSMSGFELRTVVQAKHVVNYDFPVYMVVYIHRCGRVGRVGHIDDCLITNLVASLLYFHSMSGCELRTVVQAKHVINYDFPVYMADYIHRCGRVGRVGHIDDCLITNFVASPAEVELTKKIETAVRTMTVLPNVNANITRVIHHKMMKNDLLLPKE